MYFGLLYMNFNAGYSQLSSSNLENFASVTSLGKIICTSIPHSGIQMNAMNFRNICAVSYSSGD